MKKKQVLNLNDIRCVRNRELSDADIQGMAASIGNTIMLHRLILHEYEKGKLEVIAGRCRYFALQLLKRYELPAEDYKIINSEDIALISFIENFERRQLSLLEEAEQISDLLLHHDVSEIATIIGRSEKYIRFRSNINKLTDSWKKALTADEYPHFRAGHYEVISRFPESVQKHIKKNYYLHSSISVKNFTENLDRKYSRLLITAQFDDSDCVDCEKNSNKQPWLFEELKDNSDCTCLDMVCWDKKIAAHIKKEVKYLEKNSMKSINGKDITLIVNAHYCDRKTSYKAIDSYKFEMIEVLALTGIGKANAFIVDGDDVGCYCKIRLNNQEGTAPAPQPKTITDKREQLNKRRVKRAIINLHDNIEQAKDKFKRPGNDNLLKLYSHLYVDDQPVSEINQYGKLKLNDQRDKLWNDVLSIIISQLKCHSDSTLEYIDDGIGKAVCEVLGIPWDQFIQDATVEIQTPKSLEV